MAAIGQSSCPNAAHERYLEVKNDHDRARGVFAELLAIAPGHAQGWRKLAAAAALAGQPDQADASPRMLLHLSKDRKRSAYALKKHAASGKPDKFGEAIARVAKPGANRPGARCLPASARAQAGRGDALRIGPILSPSKHMPARIIGLSHTNALRSGLASKPPALQERFDIIHMLRAVPDKQFLHADGAVKYLNPVLQQRLGLPADSKQPIFSMVGGNAHNFMGLFQHPTPYDIVLPEQAGLPLAPGAEIVTCDYAGKVLHGMLGKDLACLQALRDATQGPVYHLESPPPVFDNDFCKQNLPPAFLAERYAAMDIAPPFLRYKLWRLHSRILRQACEHSGIAFIACPSASMDESGFLRRAYYIDPLHGNAAYGELVLEQIASLLDSDGRNQHG